MKPIKPLKRVPEVGSWLSALTIALVQPTQAHTAQVAEVAIIDGLPVLNIKLGELAIDFVLDTGGQVGITVPEPLIVPRSGVELTGGVERSMDAAGNRFEVRALRANSVVIGGVQFGPVDGLVHYKWGLSVGGPGAPEVTRKGVVGLGALSQRNVLFDLAHGRIAFHERRSNDRPDVTGWNAVPFEYDARGVVVRMTVAGASAQMTLDSAATATMLRKDAAILKSMATPCVGKKADADFCGTLSLRNAAVGSDRLQDIDAAVVRMGPVPFDGVLGIDFFRRRQIYLDFDSKTMYVKPVSRSGAAHSEQKSTS